MIARWLCFVALLAGVWLAGERYGTFWALVVAVPGLFLGFAVLDCLVGFERDGRGP